MDAGDWQWLALAAVSFVAVGIRVLRRSSAGPVLLNLGRTDEHVAHLFAGVLATAGALLLYWRGRDLFPSLYFLGTGLVYMVASQGRFRICEAGLVGPGRGMIRWENIAEYQITTIGSLSVKRQSKGWKFFCDVPPELRPEVAKILALKCPGARQPGDLRAVSAPGA